MADHHKTAKASITFHFLQNLNARNPNAYKTHEKKIV